MINTEIHTNWAMLIFICASYAWYKCSTSGNGGDSAFSVCAAPGATKEWGEWVQDDGGDLCESIGLPITNGGWSNGTAEWTRASSPHPQTSLMPTRLQVLIFISNLHAIVDFPHLSCYTLCWIHRKSNSMGLFKKNSPVSERQRGKLSRQKIREVKMSTSEKLLVLLVCTPAKFAEIHFYIIPLLKKLNIYELQTDSSNYSGGSEASVKTSVWDTEETSVRRFKVSLNIQGIGTINLRNWNYKL